MIECVQSSIDFFLTSKSSGSSCIFPSHSYLWRQYLFFNPKWRIESLSWDYWGNNFLFKHNV